MNNPICVKTALLVVADDWPQLRRCDVYRMLEPFSAEARADIARAIGQHRPDLTDEALQCLIDLPTEEPRTLKA